MRRLIFSAGILLCLLGITCASTLSKAEAHGFLQGTLTLGGGWIICAIFSIRMPWHGFIGAGILALLGAARAVANLPKWFVPNRPLTLLEILTFGISMVVLVAALRVLAKERTRRMLENAE